MLGIERRFSLVEKIVWVECTNNKKKKYLSAFFVRNIDIYFNILIFMKKVLIVNKFYYPRGGDCVCAINLEKLLRQKGHEVAVFAMKYDENIQSEYSKYFASNVDFAGGIGSKLNAAQRIFGKGSIKKEFARMLNEFNPDVVHLHNIHSYLSPIVAKMAKQYGAKVVWTLHDYKLLCPSYACLNNGTPCELCYNDKKWVLKNRCMKGSLVASVLAYLEAKYWNRTKLEKYVDAFVCPSAFMQSRMKLGNFGKLNVVCNFVDPVKLELFKSQDVNDRQDYYVYVGRLSEEKGIATLVNVAKEIDFNLKIVGGGPLENQLRQICENNPQIEFLGHQDAESVAKLLSAARFSIVPSEWYENNPLSVIESLCAGTPVIGTDIGGIPELFDGKNGMIVKMGSAIHLRKAILDSIDKKWQYDKIKEKAIVRFSHETYYSELCKVYG